MTRRMFLMGAVSAVALAFSGASFAEGTADEAKAMLTKAVAAVKADKAKALDNSTREKAGFWSATSTYFVPMPATAKSLLSLTPMRSN